MLFCLGGNLILTTENILFIYNKKHYLRNYVTSITPAIQKHRRYHTGNLKKS